MSHPPFSVWAPIPQRVRLVCGDNAGGSVVEMARSTDGWWVPAEPLPPAATRDDTDYGYLLDDDPENWGELCEDVVGMEVLKKLAVPAPVAGAIGELRRAWINMPPSTLLDTLLLANQYAPVGSPLGAPLPAMPEHGDSVLDFVIDEDLLDMIRAEALETCLAMGGPLLV